jgi:hypothetical protein
MASEPLRPGTAPGLVHIVEERFKVPANPAIGRVEAARLVRAKIEAKGTPCERLDLSDIPVRRGALFDMAGTRVPFPAGEPYERCYVALVDPRADAQWAHPALWAFVPAAGDGEVVLQSTELPEHALGAVRLRPEPKP